MRRRSLAEHRLYLCECRSLLSEARAVNLLAGMAARRVGWSGNSDEKEAQELRADRSHAEFILSLPKHYPAEVGKNVEQLARELTVERHARRAR